MEYGPNSRLLITERRPYLPFSFHTTISIFSVSLLNRNTHPTTFLFSNTHRRNKRNPIPTSLSLPPMPPVAIHAKSDSDVTCSVDGVADSPRRPLYYVQSPSNQYFSGDNVSSPAASPVYRYHHSPIHHSIGSIGRFSVDSPKQPWIKLQPPHEESDVEDDEDDGAFGNRVRPYVCFVLLFIVMFTAFSLILWGASKSYRPVIVVKVRLSETLSVFSLLESMSQLTIKPAPPKELLFSFIYIII